MSTTLLPANPSTCGEESTIAWPKVGALLLIWGILIYHLAGYWSSIEQYSYGWLVPPLSLYAGFLRWRTRPFPSQPIRAAYGVIAVAAALLLPTWVFLQPSPEWRSISWMLAIETVAVTLGMFALAGGRSWFAHFFWPVCLIFTAVPWQRPFELPFTENLMRVVAKVTVELLNLSGISAVRQGSLIELRVGALGVTEACSGIRSLQASIMAAVVLGELFRLSGLKRMVLAVLAVGVALFMNVMRTYCLAWEANASGLAGVDRWHDLAGTSVLMVCFLTIWAIGRFLSHGETGGVIPRNLKPGFRTPKALDWCLTIWVVTVLIATEAWYRGDNPPPHSRWSIVPPALHEQLPMQPGFYVELRYDEGSGAHWREPDGDDWMMYLFEWKPGPLRSRISARLHRPENCLSAAGLKMITERAPVTVEGAGQSLTFRAYTFEHDGRPYFVYHGVFESRGARAAAAGSLPGMADFPGLQAVKFRERNLGQQVAELATTSFTTAAEADTAFREMMKERLVARPMTN